MQAMVETPTYPGHFLWGALREMQRDVLGLLGRLGGIGDVVRVRLGRMGFTFISKPEHIRHVLVDNVRNYSKATWDYDRLRLVLGDGLVTSEGDLWRRQRRIAQPGFHHERIARFAHTMTAAASELAERWRASGTHEVDMTAQMMRLTLRIAGLTLLSRDTGGDADAVGQALTEVLAYINDRMLHPLRPPAFVPTAANRRFKRALATLDGIVLGLIEERRHHGGADDLLQMLIEARDSETGEGMSDRQLRDEVMTMFLAGHETTGVALSWAFHCLAKNPESETRLREELRLVLGGRTPTLADLPRLAFTERVIKETMRVRPPVWFLSRRVLSDDLLDGHRLKAGSTVLFCPYITHRRPDVFPDPERFDPDRFLPEREKALPKCAYFPFAAGQRKCIGDAFAMMESQLVLATLLQQVSARHTSDAEVGMAPWVTLRPLGLRMRVASA